MDTKPTRPAPPSNPIPGAAIGRDLARLKTDGRATVAELREFVHNLRGRPPGEVLGLVTESGLIRATITATIGTVILLAIFTAGPYAWSKAFPTPVKSAATASGAAEVSPGDKRSTQEPDDSQRSPQDEEADRGNAVLNKLGESETRTSDPRKNPLEELGDDLLKDIK